VKSFETDVIGSRCAPMGVVVRCVSTADSSLSLSLSLCSQFSSAENGATHRFLTGRRHACGRGSCAASRTAMGGASLRPRSLACKARHASCVLDLLAPRHPGRSLVGAARPSLLFLACARVSVSGCSPVLAVSAKRVRTFARSMSLLSAGPWGACLDPACLGCPSHIPWRASEEVPSRAPIRGGLVVRGCRGSHPKSGAAALHVQVVEAGGLNQ